MPRNKKRKITSSGKDMKTIIDMESRNCIPDFNMQHVECAERLFSPLIPDMANVFSPDIMSMVDDVSVDSLISPTRSSDSFFDEPLTTHDNILTPRKRQRSRSPSPKRGSYTGLQTLNIETLANVGVSSLKEKVTERIPDVVSPKKKTRNIPATVTSAISSETTIEAVPLPIFSPRHFMSPLHSPRLFSPFSPFSPSISIEEELQSAIHKELIESIKDPPAQQTTSAAITESMQVINVDLVASSTLRDIFSNVQPMDITPVPDGGFKRYLRRPQTEELIKITETRMENCRRLIERSEVIIDNVIKKGMAVEFPDQYGAVKGYVAKHELNIRYLKVKLGNLKNKTKQRSNETPEEKKKRQSIVDACNRARREKETPEERRKRLDHINKRLRANIEKETPEERRKRLDHINKKRRERYQERAGKLRSNV